MAFNSYDYTQLELHINLEDKGRCALPVVVKERLKHSGNVPSVTGA